MGRHLHLRGVRSRSCLTDEEGPRGKAAGQTLSGEQRGNAEGVAGGDGALHAERPAEVQLSLMSLHLDG